MIRIILLYVLPVLLPSLLYLGWIWWRGRKAPPEEVKPPLSEGPWSWLIAAGVGLVAVIAVGSALMDESNLGKTYVPPHLDEKGNVVPGQFK